MTALRWLQRRGDRQSEVGVVSGVIAAARSAGTSNPAAVRTDGVIRATEVKVAPKAGRFPTVSKPQVGFERAEEVEVTSRAADKWTDDVGSERLHSVFRGDEAPDPKRPEPSLGHGVEDDRTERPVHPDPVPDTTPDVVRHDDGRPSGVRLRSVRTPPVSPPGSHSQPPRRALDGSRFPVATGNGTAATETDFRRLIRDQMRRPAERTEACSVRGGTTRSPSRVRSSDRVPREGLPVQSGITAGAANPG